MQNNLHVYALDIPPNYVLTEAELATDIFGSEHVFDWICGFI